MVLVVFLMVGGSLLIVVVEVGFVMIAGGVLVMVVVGVGGDGDRCGW